MKQISNRRPGQYGLLTLFLVVLTAAVVAPGRAVAKEGAAASAAGDARHQAPAALSRAHQDMFCGRSDELGAPFSRAVSAEISALMAKGARDEAAALAQMRARYCKGDKP